MKAKSRIYNWHDSFPKLFRKEVSIPGVVITIKPEIIPLVPALDNPSEGKKMKLPARPSVQHSEGFFCGRNAGMMAYMAALFLTRSGSK